MAKILLLHEWMARVSVSENQILTNLGVFKGVSADGDGITLYPTNRGLGIQIKERSVRTFTILNEATVRELYAALGKLLQPVDEKG